MGGSRRITWLVFIVGVVAVVDVLGWVTWQVLRLEREQAEARAEAARQEAMGRALWRMDSIVLPLLAIEGARPYFDYQAFYAANRPLDQMWGAAREDDVLVASPLLGEPGDYVMLHFERDAGGHLTSPQAPQSQEARAAAIAAGVPAPLMAMADIRLYELDRMQGGSGVLFSRQGEGSTAPLGPGDALDRGRASMRAGFMLDQSLDPARVTALAPGEDRRDASAGSPPDFLERSAQAALLDGGGTAAERESRDASLARNTVFGSTPELATSAQGDDAPAGRSAQLGTTIAAPSGDHAPGATPGQWQHGPEAPGGSSQGSPARGPAGTSASPGATSGATSTPAGGSSPPPPTSGAESRPEYVQDYEFRQQAAENAQLYNATGRANRARAVDQRAAAAAPPGPEQAGETTPPTQSGAEIQPLGDQRGAQPPEAQEAGQPASPAPASSAPTSGAPASGGVGHDVPAPAAASERLEPDAQARRAPTEFSPTTSAPGNQAAPGSGPAGAAPSPDVEAQASAIFDANRDRAPAPPEVGDEAVNARGLLQRMLPGGPRREPEASVLYVQPSDSAIDGLSASLDDVVSLSSRQLRVEPALQAQSRRGAEWGDAEHAPGWDRTLGETAMQPGPLRPVWIGGEAPGEPALLLVREVRVGDETREQGVWIDWPALRRALESSVSDLFPLAEVRPLLNTSGGSGVQRLATIPAVLIPGPASAAVLPAGPTGWSAMRWTLLVGWVAVGVSVVAIGVVLRKAIELGERRGRFVSAVTHELRTPLTTFRLYSQMLAGGQIGDEAKRQRYAQTLDRESQRLSAIVESVLEYARLGRRSSLGASAGGAWTRTEAGPLLERVMPTLVGRAERGGMTLLAPAEIPACRVDVDADKVERVLLNLVDNACKYAGDADDRRIVLEARLAGQGRDARLALRVRDFGPGVPESERGRVFRAFHRAKHHDASASPGLGLGLAIARGLAREMGGDLRLVDDGGSGAIFELVLPVA